MSEAFNRGTGLLVIDVVNSNPNGDPDGESEPRTFEADGRGLISPVSFKRKLRDLMFNPNDTVVEKKDSDPKENDVRKAALTVTGQAALNRSFDILETRNRKRDIIDAMDAPTFQTKYWDARIFGNTFLESLKDKEDKKSKRDKGHFITTGVVQFGPGVSVSPVEIVRLTLTNKAGVEGDKDRGMAPLAFRVVHHGLYTMPFFVNPSAAHKSGCDGRDIEVLKFLIPHAYAHTASGIRPEVHILHAWYAEHKNPLGSCPDPLILAALKPKKKAGFDPNKPSLGIDEYDVPTALPEELRSRLASFEDLCQKDWPLAGAA